MTRHRRRAAAVARRAGHVLRERWQALRNPAGWYDEVDDVYGTSTRPGAAKSVGTAAAGGLIGGGGPL